MLLLDPFQEVSIQYLKHEILPMITLIFWRKCLRLKIIMTVIKIPFLQF